MFLSPIRLEFRYPPFMLNEKFVAAYSFPAGIKLSKRTPHAHHWVSDNCPGQREFERWTCFLCGQKRIRLTAADEPELVRDWLQADAVGTAERKVSSCSSCSSVSVTSDIGAESPFSRPG